MHYTKITSASKISSDLLKFYLLSYCNINNTDATKFTRSELVSKVESAELNRRPNRPFCLVLGVATHTEKWSYFQYINVTNSSYISVRSVEQLRTYKTEKERPYRVIIVGELYFNNFWFGQFTKTRVYLNILIGFNCSKNYRLFIPDFLFSYLGVENGHFCKTNRHIPLSLISKTMSDTEHKHDVNQPTLPNLNIPPNQPNQDNLPNPNQLNPSSQPIIQQTQPNENKPTDTNQRNDLVLPSNMAVAGIPGFYGSKELKLAGTWDPDTPENSNVDDAIDLLRFCHRVNMYRNDSILIMAFLSENNQINLLSTLTQDQLDNLDSFITWLTAYNRADKSHFLNLFKGAKQNNLSFMTFFIKLKSLFRKSRGKKKSDVLSENDKEIISRQFIKNLTNTQVKTALLNQPDIAEQFDCPEKGLIAKANYFSQRFSECMPQTANYVNLSQNNDTLNNLTAQVKALTLVVANNANREVKNPDQNKSVQYTLKCYRCGRKNHVAAECRSNDKGLRGRSKSRDRYDNNYNDNRNSNWSQRDNRNYDRDFRNNNRDNYPHDRRNDYRNDYHYRNDYNRSRNSSRDRFSNNDRGFNNNRYRGQSPHRNQGQSQYRNYSKN